MTVAACKDWIISTFRVMIAHRAQGLISPYPKARFHDSSFVSRKSSTSVEDSVCLMDDVPAMAHLTMF